MNEQSISAAGAVVYWSAGPTSRELLSRSLSLLGQDAHLPAERTDASALKNAMEAYSGKSDVLVESHKRQSRNGFEVVEVERSEDRNYYTHSFSAKVESGRVVVWNGWADRSRLQELFDGFKGELTGAAVGKCLVDVLAGLGGTALRPSGGVYWIPETAVAMWQEVAGAVEAAAVKETGNSVYLLRTVMDEQAVRAVRDAIVHEVTTAAAGIAEEVASGDLGEQAIENRQARLKVLHRRVGQYEEFLGEALDTLHQIVEQVEQATVLTALQGM